MEINSLDGLGVVAIVIVYWLAMVHVVGVTFGEDSALRKLTTATVASLLAWALVRGVLGALVWFADMIRGL